MQVLTEPCISCSVMTDAMRCNGKWFKYSWQCSAYELCERINETKTANLKTMRPVTKTAKTPANTIEIITTSALESVEYEMPEISIMDCISKTV